MADPARTMRQRTIAFFEVVVDSDGEHHRVQQLPWEKTLAVLATTPLAQRRLEAGSTFFGSTATFHEEDHLLLHRVKEGGEWLSVVNWETGDWRELEAHAGEGILDTSVMCFLSFGNVVAIMQGSQAAPSHKSLEAWLNGLHFFPATRLVVRPLVSRAQVERLRTAQGASRAEIRIGRSRIAALRNHHGRLARFLRVASDEYGDIDVTMVISIPRGKARDEDRRRLLDDLRDISDVVPEAAERAQASLVYAEETGPEYSRLIELVEHHITAKRRVPAVDAEGHSIRISSAVTVILEAAAEHDAELRLASEAI
jgi:hypothetical protein